ncbi:PAS domain-containing protein [Phormidium sp. LEGE 05292]|uniref:PAS domain-containing protein n=1 Tax=[Phormidium] sp. LEGE 05292 TaxID=767427 RepID=UPI00188106D1|nr:PAS domain-containing protein [Phormidium sp. LEGE 05292]MBE9225051.1 PAS domain-containing protein [Phormidium sp. LEGE 05292]
MLKKTEKNLWELLWEYDPNGLIVIDRAMEITLVNPAFCKMFQVEREDIIGQPATVVLKDLKDFQKAWENKQVVRVPETEYPELDIYVKEVIFPIPDEDIIACIMVDITHEIHREKEMMKLKSETLAKVNEVVDNQMKVVQQIAGLLGETTAETKVSLFKIVKMLEREISEDG